MQNWKCELQDQPPDIDVVHICYLFIFIFNVLFFIFFKQGTAFQQNNKKKGGKVKA